MKSKQAVKYILILGLLICNIGCDRISKNIVRNTIQDEEKIAVIANHLTLTRTENSGAFLSVGQSLTNPLKFILLSLLPVVALLAGTVFLFLRNNVSLYTQLGLCCMIGGGIGNIYDRIVYGSVTDFMHIDLVIFQTGVFNFADVSIIIGMIVLVFNTSELKSIATKEEDS
jgi:signal peptidase II